MSVFRFRKLVAARRGGTPSPRPPTKKDLGHFILDLDSCGDQSPTLANIVSATVNGVDWPDQMEASEGRTGCDVASQNFVKFDNLPAADTHVVEFTLDDVYPPMDTTAWLKARTVLLTKAAPRTGLPGYSAPRPWRRTLPWWQAVR